MMGRKKYQIHSAGFNECFCPSPEPEHSLPVPDPAQTSQLPVRGEQEGQPGEGVHRGAVQQGGGEGDLRERARDGENLKDCTCPGVGLVRRRKHLARKNQTTVIKMFLLCDS